MKTTLLSIFNTMLITAILTAGWFGYTRYTLDTNKLNDNIAKLESKIQALESKQESQAMTEMLNSESEGDDTLKLENDEITGFTELTGYLQTSKNDFNQNYYFVFSKTSDPSLTEYLTKKSSLKNNVLLLGCSNVENTQIFYGPNSISGEMFNLLTNSSASKPVTIRVFLKSNSAQQISNETNLSCKTIIRGVQPVLDTSN